MTELITPLGRWVKIEMDNRIYDGLIWDETENTTFVHVHGLMSGSVSMEFYKSECKDGKIIRNGNPK